MTPKFSRFRSPLLARSVLLVLCLAISGCIVGALGHAISSGVTPAAYELTDQPTLVFVQITPQASDVLPTPMHRERIAANVAFHLRERKKVTEFIPQIRIHELAAQMGNRFHEPPLAIHTIASRVGARQVIIVEVREARLRDQPGMLEPQAETIVTVIEVNPYRRLFPANELADDDPRLQPPGHFVLTKLPQVHDSSPDFQQLDRLGHILAADIGRDVARLFFRWDKRDPGFNVREQ